MLINTSRGGLLDTSDALKAYHIAYLGMDVYEQEGSLFFGDHSSEIIQDEVFQRLLTLPNVLITGHQAYFTKEAIKYLSEITISNIMSFINGEELANQVKPFFATALTVNISRTILSVVEHGILRHKITRGLEVQ